MRLGTRDVPKCYPFLMQITLEIPDDLAGDLLATSTDAPRAVLELLAVEGYRSQRLSEHQVCVMLGFGTRMQVHALLKQHGVYLHYSLEDLEQDRQTAERVRSRIALPIAG